MHHAEFKMQKCHLSNKYKEIADDLQFVFLSESCFMRVILLGATGTIGLATARALLNHGHEVVCLVRDKSGIKDKVAVDKTLDRLAGTQLRFVDVLSTESVEKHGLQGEHFDAVVSCLASRTGTPSDAWAIDYAAHSQLLKIAQAAGVVHFVLLSAICVQKPLLGFQQAKLAFEKELIECGLTYSIVRPTAFFKSLSGQMQRLKQGKPFLLFGDGRLTSCKPISDHDLGHFIASCLSDADKHNCILPIGGPGEAITPLQQGEYLFKLLGKKPHYKHVPVGLLDVIITVLKTLGSVIPALADKEELARIGRYYATESMLVWNPQTQAYDAQATPSFGTQTLFEHYEQMVAGKADVQLGDHAVF
jgi:divinyl chlorophyllide a 8-vinyl-reductase